ncbi:hypothetical protein [Rhizobium sp. LjRoot258]|uniref:hypothetical protein n=1 Tax=Rhizobium sp. LjRoot258 TaxID=3342299 RepID=UPI003ED0E123
MIIVDGEETEPHLTAEEVRTLLGFVQHCRPIIVGGQAVNIWAELYHGLDEELDRLGALTSKDLDFYHNRDAERILAASLENGLLEIPSGDNHTPNAAVVTGKLGDRSVVIDFLAQIKGVEDKSLLENSITFADVQDPSAISITLMHPLDCVRSRLSNINVLGRRSEQSIRQGVASLLILDCYIDDQLTNAEDKPAVRRAVNTLRDLEFVIREKHIGKPSEWDFGDTLRPISILEKYREDGRIDIRVRDNLIQHILERLDEKQAVAEKRRERSFDRLVRKPTDTSGASGSEFG